jgi:mRNA-degrading endonuclease RelE of RelBE toxin-antitoxin system
VQYEFKSSFDRTFKKLSPSHQKKVYQTIDTLMNYLDGLAPLPPGLGLKNWSADYWEIRSGLKDRILFEFTDTIVFLFVGSHDDIKNFIKGT